MKVTQKNNFTKHFLNEVSEESNILLTMNNPVLSEYTVQAINGLDPNARLFRQKIKKNEKKSSIEKNIRTDVYLYKN